MPAVVICPLSLQVHVLMISLVQATGDALVLLVCIFTNSDRQAWFVKAWLVEARSAEAWFVEAS